MPREPIDWYKFPWGMFVMWLLIVLALVVFGWALILLGVFQPPQG